MKIDATVLFVAVWCGLTSKFNISLKNILLYLCCTHPKMMKAPPSLKVPCLLGWAHLGLNQGPPDYESGALTN
jgi:hypothetical protein